MTDEPTLFPEPDDEPAELVEPEPAEPKKKAKRSKFDDADTKPKPEQPPCVICGSPTYDRRGEQICNYCFGIRERCAEEAIEALIRAGNVTIESDVDRVVDFAVRLGDALARRRVRR